MESVSNVLKVLHAQLVLTHLLTLPLFAKLVTTVQLNQRAPKSMHALKELIQIARVSTQIPSAMLAHQANIAREDRQLLTVIAMQDHTALAALISQLPQESALALTIQVSHQPVHAQLVRHVLMETTQVKKTVKSKLLELSAKLVLI